MAQAAAVRYLFAMITAQQIRAARGLLRWSIRRLAEEAEIGVATVQRIEAKDGIPAAHVRTLVAVQEALERGGVIFIDADQAGGSGVRLRRRT